MAEPSFEQSYPAAKHLVEVRAATVVARFGLPKDARRDLAQEALLELWRKRPAYDAQRGSWRTFCERVVANRMTSLVRTMYSERSGHFREDPLENLGALAAARTPVDLQADVARILESVSEFDQRVAACLIGHSAAETSQKLGVSRATVYRSIGRLRMAFTDAGLSPKGREYECDMERASGGE